MSVTMSIAFRADRFPAPARLHPAVCLLCDLNYTAAAIEGAIAHLSRHDNAEGCPWVDPEDRAAVEALLADGPDLDDEPPFLDESDDDRAVRDAGDWMRQKVACGPIRRHELIAAGEEKGHRREHLLAAYYDLHLLSDRIAGGFLVRMPAIA